MCNIKLDSRTIGCCSRCKSLSRRCLLEGNSLQHINIGSTVPRRAARSGWPNNDSLIRLCPSKQNHVVGPTIVGSIVSCGAEWTLHRLVRLCCAEQARSVPHTATIVALHLRVLCFHWELFRNTQFQISSRSIRSQFGSRYFWSERVWI